MARGPGRPCKLTLAAQERICSALAKGLPRHVAATHGGVDYTTMRTWERKGRRQKRGSYRDFLLAVAASEKEAIDFFFGIVRKAATPHTERTVTTKTGAMGFTQTVDKKGVFDWRAAIEVLQRRWAADWGIKQTAEIAALEKQVEELTKIVMAQKAVKGDK